MRIALQLWTVRELTERDMLNTLREVAGIGYRAVELAGLGSATAPDIRRTLDETGLRLAGAHVPLRRLSGDLPALIEEMHVLGCSQIVLPAVPSAQRAPLDQVQRLAETCNQIAVTLAAAGIAFAYHNEDYDFLPLDGTTLWQAMVAHTDPALVTLQLDIFTAILMGADPVALMREHGARITSLHVCDMRERAYVPVGAGTVDWPMILEAARATAAQWVILEQDAPPRPLDDAATSLRHLRRLLATE
jgi:sugar phosphate isomerase/epimerase